MNAVTEMVSPLVFTDSAASKVKELIEEEGNPGLKIHVMMLTGDHGGIPMSDQSFSNKSEIIYHAVDAQEKSADASGKIQAELAIVQEAFKAITPCAAEF